MRRACVAGEEGVGAEQDRGAGLVDQLRHDAVVQRRGVHVDRNASEQRHHHSAGQPERVEHRQHVEHLVIGVGIDPGQRLRRIREDVAMGQHHALGRAFRARGEQHDSRIVGLAGDARRGACEQALDLVGRTDRGADVLEIDDAGLCGDRGHQLVELALLDEGLRREHGLDLRGLHGGEDVDRAGREVEHRRDPADALQRHEDDGDARGIRQQHADILAGRRCRSRACGSRPARRGSACDRSAWCRARPRRSTLPVSRSR